MRQAIADVCLGSRTLGENPIRDDYDWSFEEPDESTWQLIHMQMHRDDGVEVDIQILRPRDWIEAMDFREGAEFEVDLPHTSAHGLARIVAMSACPALAAGEGSLVIGKFETRNAKELVKVTMEDDSVITGTRIHPVWSVDRNAWVELGHLEVGETLLGADGPTKVQCLTFLAANQPVYNLEVFGEHVYRVGNSGVLCHNTGDGVCTFVLKPGAPKEAVQAASLLRAQVYLGRNLKDSLDPAVDFVDDFGRTYDQMGNPAMIPYWASQKQQFFHQIDRHLQKADFTILDLTSFPQNIQDEVAEYVMRLPENLFEKIIPIGF